MNENKVVGICPHCGSAVREHQYGWICSNRDCKFVLWKNNAFLSRIGKVVTAQMVEGLSKDGEVYMEGCTSRKNGRVYNVELIMSVEDDGRPHFSLEFNDHRRVGDDDGKEDR